MAISPKALLDSYNLLPKKSLGQHFMHDPNTLAKIVAAARLQAGDVVVEVGAGAGALTQVLADAGAQVYAIEVDERLQPILEARFEDESAVYLVFADILKIDVATLAGDDEYVVVANVPYYISSAILWHFLESRRPPLRMLLTMQYEVAERIISAPGAMNLLAIAVQFYGLPRIISKLSPAVFWPRPHIHSAIVSIETHRQPPVDVPSAQAFFRVLRAGFSQKRKQLRNSLAGGLGIKTRGAADLLGRAEIDPQRRAETLTLEEWARLTRIVADAEPPR